jgi:cytidylate kinase
VVPVGAGPSSNRTTARVPTLQLVSGDELIRRIPAHQRLDRHAELFSDLLTTVDERRRSSNIVVDSALSAQQVREARVQFQDKAAFVLLRVNESDRVLRERKRRDRRLTYTFQQEWHDLVGPDELYDLVLDTSSLNPAQCTTQMIRAVQRVWQLIEL